MTVREEGREGKRRGRKGKGREKYFDEVLYAMGCDCHDCRDGGFGAK